MDPCVDPKRIPVLAAPIAPQGKEQNQTGTLMLPPGISCLL
jgi:hypothetical protein